MSMLVKEYNKANIKDKEIKIFTQDVNVSLLDVLNSNQVEVIVKGYLDCACKSSVNLKDYYTKCSKCDGKGTIYLNKHEVVCNECKGEKYIRIHDCYVCNNKGKVFKDMKLKIKLNDKMKSGDKLTCDFDDYKLILTLNIYDELDYVIKDKDVYMLKTVKYSKDDFNKRVIKKVNTVKGNREIKSEFKIKNEIVKINNAGIDNGDFYVMLENDIDITKETVYVNVLLDQSGYVNIEDLIKNKIVIAKKSIALNEVGYLYIDSNVNEYEDDNYIIKINKFNVNDFEINEEVTYIVNLEKEDLENDKKTILINNEKINLAFKKNLKENMYLYLENKGFLNKDGKKEGIKIKIIPFIENIYKISIKKNNKTVFVEDYKYSDYRVVETYKKSDYLENYIKINDEEEIYVNNDKILIKRV